MPETLKAGDIFEVPAQPGKEPTYGRIIVLGPSNLSTKVGSATQAEFEQQQAEQKIQ